MTPPIRLTAAVFLLTGGLIVAPHARVRAASFVTLPSTSIPAVASGAAKPMGAVRSNAMLRLVLGLPVRNQKALTSFIDAKVPEGYALTQQQFDRRFGASASQVRRAVGWAETRGFYPTYVSKDGFTIAVRGTAHAAELAFHTTLERYRLGTKSFYANTAAARVSAGVGIESVTGLDDRYVARFHARKGDVPGAGFDPTQFRAAYDEQPSYDGTSQTVGITGFGPPTAEQDLQQFASATGDPLITTCGSTVTSCPEDSVQWIQVGKPNSEPDVEETLDVEYLHAMAVHSTMKYWLGGNGDESPMEQAISEAANDSSLHIVSNSWSQPGVDTSNDPFVTQTTTSFEHAVAVGTTFYFATGDYSNDNACKGGAPVRGCHLEGVPAYPAASPYVVAVGATNLQMTPGYTAYQGETSWSSGIWDNEGSGGGCAKFQSRPSWQTDVSAATCNGRAIPDMSADGDPDTGARVYYDCAAPPQSCYPDEVGGTSLSTPLIAGMQATTDEYLLATTQSICASDASYCFTGPPIYQVAASNAYVAAFHDVYCGTNGWPAGYHWDQVTGWGSIDWLMFSKALAGDSVAGGTPPTAWVCNPPASASAKLKAISCSGALHCWAAGAGGTLFSTADGWSWQITSPISEAVAGISCPAKLSCDAVTTSGTILRTVDGGHSWKKTELKRKGPFRISCPSTTSCFLSSQHRLFASTDGLKFSMVRLKAAKDFAGLSCSNTTHCYAIETNGTVIRLRQGAWAVVPKTTESTGTIAALDCPRKNRCYAVGTALTPKPRGPSALIYSTQTGGKWTAQIDGASGPLDGVSCARGRTCDAVGSQGDILRTVNGADWQAPFSTPPSGQWTAVSCRDSRCYMASNSGHVIEVGAAPGH
jgi:kumamolisin